MGGAPVRHHEPVESPLVAEDRGEESLVLRAELTCEAVVGGHHAPGVALLHGGLERPEVDLAQDPLVDDHVD